MPDLSFPRSHRALPAMLLALVMLVPAAHGATIPADLELVVVVPSAGSRPVAVRHAGDGSNRLFIVLQAGEIVIYDLDTATLLGAPFLDIRSLGDDLGNEQGVLALAFHPDYASNGFFFVNYTRDPGTGLDRTVVKRYTVSAGDPNLADDTSGVTVLEIEQDFSNHNGGGIEFGPDGYLYVGMGDGGSGGDPNNRAQDPMQLLGKMLRIDIATSSRAARDAELCGLVGNYSIPPDNPFAGNDGTCDEIWALGTRNPWRFSFDRLTGDLFIGDVGQGAWEEVDYQLAASSGGENWGWRCYEGNHPYNTSGCGAQGDYDFPILEVSHSGGNCSITGGYRYRGTIPGLYGTYIYGDFCSGKIWIAEENGGWTSTEWMDTSHFISSFGEDEAGELYLVDLGGSVYRFESASSGSIFADGFESGDTTAW